MNVQYSEYDINAVYVNDFFKLNQTGLKIRRWHWGSIAVGKNIIYNSLFTVVVSQII